MVSSVKRKFAKFPAIAIYTVRSAEKQMLDTLETRHLGLNATFVVLKMRHSEVELNFCGIVITSITEDYT